MKNRRAEFLKYGWLFAAISVSAWLLFWFQFGKFYWGSVFGMGVALVLLGSAASPAMRPWREAMTSWTGRSEYQRDEAGLFQAHCS